MDFFDILNVLQFDDVKADFVIAKHYELEDVLHNIRAVLGNASDAQL